jgi:hypothetical protein
MAFSFFESLRRLAAVGSPAAELGVCWESAAERARILQLQGAQWPDAAYWPMEYLVHVFGARHALCSSQLPSVF